MIENDVDDQSRMKRVCLMDDCSFTLVLKIYLNYETIELCSRVLLISLCKNVHLTYFIEVTYITCCRYSVIDIGVPTERRPNLE